MKQIPSLTDDFVLTVFTSIQPQVQALAVRHHADPDDLQQETALRLLLQAPTIAAQRNPASYSIGIARKLLLMARSQDHHRSVVNPLSFDAPLSVSDEVNLQELTCPPLLLNACDTTQKDRLIACVHTALRRLPLEEQLYLCEVHHITAYEPMGQSKRSYDLRQRRERNLARINGLRHLRQDTELQQAVLEVLA